MRRCNLVAVVLEKILAFKKKNLWPTLSKPNSFEKKFHVTDKRDLMNELKGRIQVQRFPIADPSGNRITSCDP